MDKLILPSLIATSQDELDERFVKVQDDFSTFHLDIMDGEFVANHSLDFAFTLPGSSSSSDKHFEAHLMVAHPEDWIEQHLHLVDTVFVHLEACTTPFALIQFVHERGKNIGFVLNPETSVDDLAPFVALLDYVLFMTVVPGQYGAAFVEDVVAKIAAFHAAHPEIPIQIDGSMNPETIGKVVAAGASRFVVGSYLQKAPSIQEAVDTLTKHF